MRIKNLHKEKGRSVWNRFNDVYGNLFNSLYAFNGKWESVFLKELISK